MAVGVPKKFKIITKFSMPTTYVDNPYPLLTTIIQELGKLAILLADRAEEVGAF